MKSTDLLLRQAAYACVYTVTHTQLFKIQRLANILKASLRTPNPIKSFCQCRNTLDRKHPNGHPTLAWVPPMPASSLLDKAAHSSDQLSLGDSLSLLWTTSIALPVPHSVLVLTSAVRGNRLLSPPHGKLSDIQTLLSFVLTFLMKNAIPMHSPHTPSK